MIDLVFSLLVVDDGVVVVIIDVLGEKMNILCSSFVEDLKILFKDV